MAAGGYPPGDNRVTAGVTGAGSGCGPGRGVLTVHGMEGPRLGEITAAPEAGGVLHAWVPDGRYGCGFCGAETHAEDADELAAKLAGA